MIDTGLLAAADDVFDELAKAMALPAEAKGCLAALSATEGPHGFRELYRGNGPINLWPGSLDTFPDWEGRAIPDDDQNRVSHATGAWQFLRATWDLVAGMTGRVDFSPQSQIANAWVLAAGDFERNGGGDLIASLKAGRLDDVHKYLRRTWAGGADPNFPARYRAALPRFQTAAQPGGTIEIPLGLAVSYPIKAWSKKHEIPVPDDAVVVEDQSICRSPEIVGDRITLQSVALGQTRASGADFSAPILVYKPTPDHIEVDLTKPTFSQIAASMRARLPLMAGAGALALMLLVRPAGLTEPPMFFFAPTKEAAKSDVPPPLSPEPGMISKGDISKGDSAETFCFGPDHGFPITICRP